jgi:hypothetical protein
MMQRERTMADIDDTADDAAAAFLTLAQEQRAGFAALSDQMTKLEKRLPNVAPSIAKMEDAVGKIEPLVASINRTPMLQTTLDQQAKASLSLIIEAMKPQFDQSTADRTAMLKVTGIIRDKQSQTHALIGTGLAGAGIMVAAIAALLWATDRMPLPRSVERMTVQEKQDVLNTVGPAVMSEKRWKAMVAMSQPSLSSTVVDELERCNEAAQQRTPPAKCSLAIVPPK